MDDNNVERYKEGAVILYLVNLVMLAIVLLLGIVLSELSDFDAMPYLGLAGFVYGADYLDGGVYYHHTGSSYSQPRGSPSWIRAIAKAHDVDKNELDCCVSGCNESADVGAHLTESRIMEIISLVPGLGGTPVVPVCYHHHGTGPVEIDDTPCIYDKGTPIDILWGKPSLSNVCCSYCDSYTSGPDAEDYYWCPECDHVVDDDGDCVTEGCTSDGCCDDDDDDDDDWW